MEGKKISFGFMKTKKAEKPVVEDKRDYIECVEEKSIKVVGGETIAEDVPLVIPMKPNTLITAERLKEIADKVESSLQEPEEKSNNVTNNIEIKQSENETLDQMAVRELLQESNKVVKVEDSVLTVPVPSKPVIEGQKESTLEDYNSIPIQDFGLAMLRGMGWTPGKDESKYKQPQLRPKGLGLGADKVIKDNQKKKSKKGDKDEELSIVKNSYVKITTGKHSGYYGKVVSLDEDTGRVTVDITVKKETVSLSEFMMQPVTKAEFDKESKVINTDAFESYKKNEKSQSQKSSRNESPQRKDKSNNGSQKSSDKEASSSQKSSDSRKESRKDVREESRRKDYEKSSGRSKESEKYVRSRRDSSSSDDNSRRRKEKSKRDATSSEDRSKKRAEKDKRYSSNESLSSASDSERKKNKNHRRRKDSSESEVEKHKKDKRDIDKKRKGKKKKRDRDRSPNYKKHRK